MIAALALILLGGCIVLRLLELARRSGARFANPRVRHLVRIVALAGAFATGLCLGNVIRGFAPQPADARPMPIPVSSADLAPDAQPLRAR